MTWKLNRLQHYLCGAKIVSPVCEENVGVRFEAFLVEGNARNAHDYIPCWQCTPLDSSNRPRGSSSRQLPVHLTMSDIYTANHFITGPSGVACCTYPARGAGTCTVFSRRCLLLSRQTPGLSLIPHKHLHVTAHSFSSTVHCKLSR